MYEHIETTLQADVCLKFKCNLCHREDDLDGYIVNNAITQIMQERQVCFQCAFWMDKIAHPCEGTEIIGGHYYIVYPFVKRPENVLKGSYGKEFYIRKFDGTLLKSNNVWYQGEIPEHFRDQYPNTANFLSLLTYMRLLKDNHKCYAKGCWDRYHCVRYDLSCESGSPFNIVPKKHVIGNEKCPSFININKLKI